jgi:hypothetical protein
MEQPATGRAAARRKPEKRTANESLRERKRIPPFENDGFDSGSGT